MLLLSNNIQTYNCNWPNHFYYIPTVWSALNPRSASPCINYMQYPWGYAVLVRICITRELYHQYRWVISSVPVSHIISTCESYHQYPWVISSVPVRICSTPESYPQYPWVNLYEWRMNETSLTGTAYPHSLQCANFVELVFRSSNNIRIL